MYTVRLDPVKSYYEGKTLEVTLFTLLLIIAMLYNRIFNMSVFSLDVKTCKCQQRRH